MLSDQDENKKIPWPPPTLTLLSLVFCCALKEGFIPLEDFQTLWNIIDMFSCGSHAPSARLYCRYPTYNIESATCRWCVWLEMPCKWTTDVHDVNERCVLETKAWLHRPHLLAFIWSCTHCCLILRSTENTFHYKALLAVMASCSCASCVKCHNVTKLTFTFLLLIVFRVKTCGWKWDWRVSHNYKVGGRKTKSWNMW